MKHLHLNSRTGLVLDPHSGTRFRVNKPGAAILLAWQQGRSPLELLTRHQDLSRNEAERVLHAFSRQCRQAGLCPPVQQNPVPDSAALNPTAA